MARRRFRYNKETDSFVEITEGSDIAYLPADSGALWGDSGYENLRATDGTDISTRTKHREYMKQHGLTTVDDYKEHWKKTTAARDAYRTQGIGGAVRKEDVVRAIEQLERRK